MTDYINAYRMFVEEKSSCSIVSNYIIIMSLNNIYQYSDLNSTFRSF
jgi:hypothetical protein